MRSTICLIIAAYLAALPLSVHAETTRDLKDRNERALAIMSACKTRNGQAMDSLRQLAKKSVAPVFTARVGETSLSLSPSEYEAFANFACFFSDGLKDPTTQPLILQKIEQFNRLAPNV